MLFLRLISVVPFAGFGVGILLSSTTTAFLLPTTPCSCSSSIDRTQHATAPIVRGHHGHHFAFSSSSFLLASSSSIDDATGEEEQQQQDEDVELVKRKLVRLCAAYDRGFGATQRSKQNVAELIQQLEDANRVTELQMTTAAAAAASPLQGSWQLLWTTAPDVLVLNASPFSTVGAIYQVFDLPIVTNIIDLLPRIQAVLPSTRNTNLETVVRAEVQTRATARTEDSPLRVGLEFEAVTIKPIQILGQRVDTNKKLGGFLPPPVATFDLPKIPGTDSSTGPGYFDVTYLDDDLLIIQQNAPGGLFVLSKTEDSSP